MKTWVSILQKTEFKSSLPLKKQIHYIAITFKFPKISFKKHGKYKNMPANSEVLLLAFFLTDSKDLNSSSLSIRPDIHLQLGNKVIANPQS